MSALEIIDSISGPVGALALLVIVWRFSSMATWLETMVGHLDKSVTRIEKKVDTFHEANEKEHRELRRNFSDLKGSG